MCVKKINKLSTQATIEWFALTCTASRWCELMASSRPFLSEDDVIEKSELHWAKMEHNDVMEAFAGHPMIGDITSLKAKYANTESLAKNEQGGMDSASDEVFERLKNLNHAYLEKHGFIFIICASGLTAAQMLHQIQLRVNNTTEQEFATAAAEQLKITKLRIAKAFAS